jgi:NADH-quinone oxidoreductase subunit E
MSTEQTLNQEVMQSIIKRYPRSRSAIMPLLHYVQSISGYVTNDGIEVISKLLEIETAEVSAVATFLHPI